jgi:hypothetical protein
LDDLKERIVDIFKTYEEPEMDKDGKFISKKVLKAPKHNPDAIAEGEGIDQ